MIDGIGFVLVMIGSSCATLLWIICNKLEYILAELRKKPTGDHSVSDYRKRSDEA